MAITSQIRTAVTTFVVTVVALVVLAVVAVFFGVLPANADAKPGFVEQWAAHESLQAAIDRGVKPLKNPLAVTDSVMTAGVKLYGTHCAVCHGTSDAKPSSIAAGLYQRPPQFAKHGVSDDPAEETYWKITHGIRLTGMPAYVTSLSTNERWQIASFLRYQDSLPPNALAAWKALPSAANSDRLPAGEP
jgi:thiosulfate dehydrogenase